MFNKMRAKLQDGTRIRDNDSKSTRNAGGVGTGVGNAEEIPVCRHRTPYIIRQLSINGDLVPVMKA